ncbi:hypothetical protein [Thermomonas sp.]|uniref:hypothetical protein n=1 Tax=Thermomonas sp. TaxID=1971895 RepID=UPI00248A41E9|nr:hypothetical protein [Thermomonas sp.]MDI1253552.1 hypothetical protein [Thermomonas sp.]
MLLWSLALLAPFSLLVSDLPRGWAWPLAIAAALLGVFDARRHARLRPCVLVIPIGRGQPTCDGQPMQALKVEWRGSLAFLRWREPDGRIRRLVFWPDILPSTSRRELRLATMRVEPARETASVAR